MEKSRNKLVSRGKRIAVLLLCCAYCLAYVGMQEMTAFAYDCGHANWNAELRNIKYTHQSNTVCKCVYDSYMVCNVCTAEIYLGQSSFTTTHEYGRAYSATCNGVTQSIYSTCNKCRGTAVKSQKCPAGPHASGYCPASPLSLEPIEIIK